MPMARERLSQRDRMARETRAMAKDFYKDRLVFDRQIKHAFCYCFYCIVVGQICKLAAECAFYTRGGDAGNFNCKTGLASPGSMLLLVFHMVVERSGFLTL